MKITCPHCFGFIEIPENEIATQPYNPVPEVEDYDTPETSELRYQGSVEEIFDSLDEEDK